MNSVSIGIVEDEMIIADVLALTLRKLGYTVSFTAPGYNEAVKMIEDRQPDLLLLDINLGGQKDGIDVAKYVRLNYSIPIIFLTANSDKATIDRAKEVKPNAFLVKPFTKDHLFAAIEIAMDNHIPSTSTSDEFILVKDGYSYVKVPLRDLRYMCSEQNYVVLNLADNKKVLARSTLSEMHNKLNHRHYIKINRSCIVNLSYVSKVETDKVFIGQEAFTVNKAQRNAILQRLYKN